MAFSTAVCCFFAASPAFPPAPSVHHGIAQRNLQLVRIDPCGIQRLGITIRQPPHGRHGVFEIPPLAPARPAKRHQFPLQRVRPLHELLGLLPLGQFRRRRASLQDGDDALRRRLVRQRQIQGSHAVVVLKMQRVGIGVHQQLDHFDRGLVGRRHVEGQAPVLVPAGGAVGVVDQEELDGVGGGLPHGRLVEGEVADAVGLGGALGVGFEEGVDDVLGGLEGAGGVEGEVAPVVDSAGFFWELGCLGTAEQGPKSFAQFVQGGVRHGCKVFAGRITALTFFPMKSRSASGFRLPDSGFRLPASLCLISDQDVDGFRCKRNTLRHGSIVRIVSVSGAIRRTEETT